MKRILLSLTAVAFTVSMAGVAFAQNPGEPPCSFDNPKKAKGLKSSMVRVRPECGNSTSHPSVNSQTGAGGAPACAPIINSSSFELSAKGSCSVSTKMKAFFDQPAIDDPLEKKHANGCWPDFTEPSCMNLDIKVKCSGVSNPGGAGEVNAGDEVTPSGWKLATLTRATFDDRTNGGLTVINFPVQFDIQQIENGKIKDKFQANVALFALFGAGSSLPPCSSLENINISISDDTGAPFVGLGSATGGGQ